MADGVVTIDLKFPANGSEFQSDVVKVQEILKKIGSGTGEQAVASFSKESAKLKSTAKETGSQVSKSVNAAGKNAGGQMQKKFSSNAKAVVKSASTTADSVSSSTAKMGKGAGGQMQKDFGHNSEDVKESASDMGQDVDKTAKNMGKGAGDEMADSADRNSDKVKRSFGSLGEYIEGSFIGSTLEKGTEKVTEFFTEMVSQATESFDTLKAYQSTMKFAGFDTSEIKKSEEELKEYSKATIYNVGEMSNTAATLAANGVKNYVGVTKALGNLVAVAGGNADDMKSASLALTQIVGAGKMYTGDWDQFINGIPGASGKIQKALKDAGAYTGNFKDAMSKGKISAQDMIAAVEKLGNTKIAKKAATDTSQFSVAWQGAQESVQDGILALMNSLGTGGFTGAVSAAGDSAYKALAGIGSWITKNKGNIDTLGEKLSYIAGGLKKIAGSIGQGFIDFFKDAYRWIDKTVQKTSGGKDTLDSLGIALDKVSKHKDTLAVIGKGLGAITTALLAMKAIRGVTTIVTTALKPIVGLFGTIMSIPGGPIILAIAAIGTAFVLAYKNIKPFRDFINGIGKMAKEAFDSVAKVVKDVFGKISKVMSSIVDGVEKTWKKFGVFMSHLWDGIVKVAKTAFAPVAQVIKNVFGKISKEMSPIVKEAKGVWKQFGEFMSALWDDIVKVVSKAVKEISTIFKAVERVWKLLGNFMSKLWDDIVKVVSKAVKKLSPVFKALGAVVKVIEKAWKQFSNFMSNLWDGIVKVVSKAINKMSSIVKTVMALIKIEIDRELKAVKTIWSTAWKIIMDVLKAAWNVIKTIIITGLKIIQDVLKVGTDLLKGNWKGAWNGVKRIFKDAWDGMKSIVSDVWKGIKGVVEDGVNGVIDLVNGMIGAINKVWSFFGGKGGIDKLGHVHFSTGGQLGSDGSVLAIVNDDGSPDPRELIQRNDGTLQMYQERNAKTIINPGDKVYNSKQTKEIFDSVGVHYAKGNVGGDIFSGIKSFFGGVADKLKDAIEWLKHPLRNTAKLIKSATDSFMSILPDNFKNLAGSMIGKMTGMISDKLKKLIHGFKDDNEDGGGAVGNPGGAGVTRWRPYVIKALKANGLSTSDAMVAKVLRQIATESGGNPGARQPGADPDGDGSGPALGLMQTKRGTFNAFKFPGHDNIFNGYDDLLAGLRYAKARYGPSLSFLGNGHGYAQGGVIDREQMALIGEGNKTEFVVPNPSVAGPARTYEMIGRAAAYASQAEGGNGSLMSGNALKVVERKLDALIDYSATQLDELKKPTRSYVLQSDIYKGYNNQQKINDMRDMFVR